MAASQSIQGRLNIGYQGSQFDQVGYLKMGSPGRNDNEGVLRLDACPACRQGCNIAEAVAIKEQIIAPSDAAFDAVDLLSEQRVKRVSDPDGRRHFSWATCS
jgi:hypothetical protein